MANDPTLYERLRGKRTSDIRLPAEGKMDPRLLKYHPFEAIKATKQKLYDEPMGQLNKVLEGLKKAR